MTSCPICRHGSLRAGTSDEVMTHAHTIVVVKGVPAEICDTCGESLSNEVVTERLLELVRDGHAHGIEVRVLAWNAS